MATTHGAVHVNCRSCSWRGTRVPFDPLDPNRATVASGFGPCPSCGGRLKRATALADRRAAKAKAELQALAQGDRL